MKTPAPRIPFWFAPVCLLLLAAPASAITITWTNLAGGDWVGATNWSPNQVPTASDVAVINGTTAYAITVTGSRTTGGLVMDNPNAILRVLGRNGSSHATLTVTNGFASAGTIELTSQDLTYNAALTVTSGALTNAVGGVIRVLEGTAGSRTLGLELDNRGTLQIERNTSLTKSGGKHRFAGTVDLAAGTTLTIGTGGLVDTTHAGANWTGTGTLDLPSSRPFILETDFTLSTITLNLQNVTVQGPGTLTVPLGRTLTFQTTTMDAPFNLLGTLENWASSSINSLFSVPAGGMVRVLGRAVSSHATLTVANGFANQGTIELTSQDLTFNATLNVTSGALTNALGGVVRVLEGTAGGRTLGLELDNRGTLQIERNTSLTKSGGKHRFAGTVDLAVGTALTISGGAGVKTTHAGANWTGTGTLNLPNSRPFNLETDYTAGTITLNLANADVNGPGQFNVPADRTVTFTATSMNAPFNLLGTLESRGSSSINSPFSIPAGAFVRVLGRNTSSHGTLTVANGFANQGTIELTSEDTTFNATLTVTSGALTNAVGGLVRVLEGTAGGRTLGLELDNRGTLQIDRPTNLTKNAAKHRNSGLIEVQVGELTLTQSGTSPSFSNDGELRVLTGATFRPTSGNWTNAVTGVLGGAGTFNLTAGTLANLGTVSPGVSPGILSVTGNYPGAASTTLELELGGFTSGTDHDALAVAATANLNGTIRAALTNGFYPKKDDTFTVLTYATRSGSFASLVSAEPHRIAWRVEYGTTSAQLIVDNSAPTFVPIANQTVDEQTLLSLTAVATDQDLPAQTLTYSLDVNPPGMTINANSGQLEWTPTEAQGPGVYNVTLRATDNGTPVLFHTNSFTVTVNEVNLVPQLTVPAPQTVNELVELVFTISATDADLPANALTYQMLSGPTGATFNPATREFRWTPTEVQGPGVSNATFRVTDNSPNAVNTQQLSATNSLAITVNEVNVAPQLTVPGPQSINELVELVFTISSTDADLPANALTYQMLSGPAGATFNPATREFRWTPTEAQGPGVSNATFRVTDNNPNAVNTQQLSATNSVAITVNEINVAPQLTVPGPPSVNELVELILTISATDADLPANALTYQMLTGPTGATFNPVTREFRWTPTEAQGPGVSNATFRVTDNNPNAVNTQQLSATNSVAITVNEVNVAPVLAVVPNATIHAGTTYRYPLGATDADQPTNSLTYSLVSGPAGATVGGSGLIAWAAPLSVAGATTNFTVRVTDNGVPSLPADRSFQVTVVGPLEITGSAREAGGFRVEWSSVPGLNYRLLSTPALPSPQWTTVGSDLEATATTSSRLDASAGTISNRLYRVLLVE